MNVRRKTVDSTYQGVTAPSMQPPKYAVAPGARCAPLNAPVALSETCDRFTIVGVGKTGMDACLWLLGQGVDPGRLTWVMPRDSWLIDRSLCQPGPLFANQIGVRFYARGKAMAEATSIDDLFDRLEAAGLDVRLDKAVRPKMYRCATVSRLQLAAIGL